MVEADSKGLNPLKGVHPTLSQPQLFYITSSFLTEK